MRKSTPKEGSVERATCRAAKNHAKGQALAITCARGHCKFRSKSRHRHKFLQDKRQCHSLLIPDCKTSIHIAVPLQSKSNCFQNGICCFSEKGARSTDVIGQLTRGIDECGKPCSDRDVILAVVPPSNGSSVSRTFQVSQCPNSFSCKKDNFEFKSQNENTLTLFEDQRPVLSYNYGSIIGKHVPKSEPRRKRAAYVHPIWGLNGEVLTGDFPKDHYHHHGLFWAWPHVSINGIHYNLWEGFGIKHKFVRWLGRESGPVAATIGIENGWFVESKKVMIERVWMRVFKSDKESRNLDVHITWIPVGNDITLLGAENKSYGGLALRFNAAQKERPVITVPTGVADKDLYVTRLPWADFTAHFEKGGPRDKTATDNSLVDSDNTSQSGLAVFVHPQHPAYPPTWLTRHYGVLCIGWPGVESRTFPVGKPFSLSYRLRIHDGTVTAEQLNQICKDYVAGCMQSQCNTDLIFPTKSGQ